MTTHLEALAELEGPPMAKTGRDLRMTLDIRCTTPFDAVVGRVIEKAVRENGEGDMHVGKRTTVTEADVTVVIVMTDYRQTWDGDDEEEEPAPSPPIARILELDANPSGERATFDLVQS